MEVVMKRVAIMSLCLILIATNMAGCSKVSLNAKEGVYYEIFVRSFADSDGDGIGDIQGIIEKLDYLNDGDASTTDDLGVTGIWLMPIMPSPTYHKYDVSDYYDIDEEYGTIDDFKKLIKEAHKRGISVIIDLVINHTSVENEWFIKALADDPVYKDYYQFATVETEGINLDATVWGHDVWIQEEDSDEYYYAIFWDQMPDLNFENPAVREEIKKVAGFWLDLGVDGFRLDAAKHLYGDYEYAENFNLTEKNVAWWDEFRTYVLSKNEDAILVAEVWDTPEVVEQYAGVFDIMFDFEAAADITQLVVGSNNQDDLGTKLYYFHKAMDASSDIFIDAPFLSNHDQNRIINSLSNDKVSNRIAAAIYLTLPGVPFIYYGEELGMKGTKPDQYIRQPFLWGADSGFETTWVDKLYNKTTPTVSDQLADEDSLLNYYKSLIQLRYEYEALLSGDFETIKIESENLFGYFRNTEDSSLFVLHNVSYEDEVYTNDILNGENVQVIFQYNGVELDNGSLIMPSKSSVIVKIK